MMECFIAQEEMTAKMKKRTLARIACDDPGRPANSTTPLWFSLFTLSVAIVILCQHDFLTATLPAGEC